MNARRVEDQPRRSWWRSRSVTELGFGTLRAFAFLTIVRFCVELRDSMSLRLRLRPASSGPAILPLRLVQRLGLSEALKWKAERDNAIHVRLRIP